MSLNAEIYLKQAAFCLEKHKKKKKKKKKTDARIPSNHQQCPQSYKSAVETKFICSTYA